MLEPLQRHGRPHWETWCPQENWIYFENFIEFEKLVWHYLRLPEPTEAQCEIGHYLQHGADSSQPEEERVYSNRKSIIRCFRALGKSYISAAFTTWKVMRNPRDEMVLVLSATGGKSKDFVTQVKGLMETVPLCKWLISGTREDGVARRDLADSFDVMGASLSQSPSVSAKSSSGQITGSRATTIIADDIEIRDNSLTQEAREKLLHLVRSDLIPIATSEFGVGDIIMLGTPSTEESIYNTCVSEIGFDSLCIPSRYPMSEKLESYIITRTDKTYCNILAPYLRKKFEDGVIKEYEPTDRRFSEEDLAQKEASGKAVYALQYQLDTSLSDLERYPLKTQDFICMPLNALKAPITVAYGVQKDKANILRDIPNIGFSGDFFCSAMFIDQTWSPYERIVAYIDIAGRGADETAVAVCGVLNGYIFLLDIVGFRGDVAECMVGAAKTLDRYKVNVAFVEANYSGESWLLAFNNILKKFPVDCAMALGEWTNTMKEQRIIDTVEPMLGSHKVVIDDGFVRRDVKQDDKSTSFIWQLTHVMNERGALKHDDKLDAFAGLLTHLQALLAVDTEEAVRGWREDEWEKEKAVWYPDDEDKPKGEYSIDFDSGERTSILRYG